MSRVRVSNSLTTKLFTIIFVILFVAAVLILCVVVFNKDKNNNVFDLGNINSDLNYTDQIVNSYADFVKLTEKYQVSYSASNADFANHSFLFIFQDYNPCSESKLKTIQNVSIEDNVVISFKVYSQCGWCQRHMVLYILKTDKIDSNKKLEFKYLLPNDQVDCGVVN